LGIFERNWQILEVEIGKNGLGILEVNNMITFKIMLLKFVNSFLCGHF
jgi:hypothetical protein